MPEDLTERSEGKEDKEAEQELQYQHQGDLQHVKDFAGNVLQVSEDRGVMMELYSEIWGILTSVYRCFSGVDNAIPCCNVAWEEVLYRAGGMRLTITGIVFSGKTLCS